MTARRKLGNTHFALKGAVSRHLGHRPSLGTGAAAVNTTQKDTALSSGAIQGGSD